MNRRFWGWCAFWGFLAWWVVQNPHQAGAFVHHVGGFLSHAAHSLSVLVSSI
jgi:hypothetical protein